MCTYSMESSSLAVTVSSNVPSAGTTPDTGSTENTVRSLVYSP